MAAIQVVALSSMAALARAQGNDYQIGDACQLTQTVQACQALAKSFKYSTGLYAAIASSEAKQVAGVSHGQPTQSTAEQTALADCKALGATDCKIQESVQNSCTAFAASVTTDSTGTTTARGYSNPAANRDLAAANALLECRTMIGKGMNACVVRVAPCATDNPAYPSRLPQPAAGQLAVIDPNLVGTWEIEVGSPSTGRWLWQVTASGTYEVHSEAFDNAPTNAGTFSARGGNYTLHAINISWDDSGTYTFQPPATLVATGKLGSGTWHKISQDDE